MVLDAYAGGRVPAELTTVEFLRDVRRVLRPAGVALLNVADEPGLRFVARVVAGAREAFGSVALIATHEVLKGKRFGNTVVVASASPLDLPVLRRKVAGMPFPTGLRDDAELRRQLGTPAPWTGRGQQPVTAPAPAQGLAPALTARRPAADHEPDAPQRPNPDTTCPDSGCAVRPVGRARQWPKAAGRVAVWAARRSASGRVNCPWTSSASPTSSTTPMRAWAKPRAEHMSVNRTSSERGTATTARPVDSLNSAVNGSIPSRSHTSSSQIRAPTPWRSDASARAMARPPSDRSCAASTRPSREALTRISAELPLPVEVDRRRQAAEVLVLDVGPLRAAELVGGGAEQVDHLAGRLPARGRAAGDVVHDAEHADDGRRVDRDVAGLVVERHVAAGDRDAELAAAVAEPADGLGELPHDARVLGRAEVEAVGHGQRHGAGGRDVAVGLGERQLGPGVGVELGEAAVAVGRDGDPAAGLLVDPDHAGVVGLRERGVAHDVAVVLVGHPGLVAQVG